MLQSTSRLNKFVPIERAEEAVIRFAREAGFGEDADKVFEQMLKFVPVEEGGVVSLSELSGFLGNMQKALQYSDPKLLFEKRGLRVSRIVDVQEFAESPEYMNQKGHIRPAILSELVRLFEGGNYVEAVLCLAGDTPVPLLDGTMPTIKELAETRADDEFWIYSHEDGKKVPALAKQPRKTGRDTMWRVTFTDETYVEGNSRHQFILTSGAKVMIKDLKPGDRLESLYLYHEKIAPRSREYACFYEDGERVWVHRWVTDHCRVFGDLPKALGCSAASVYRLLREAGLRYKDFRDRYMPVAKGQHRPVNHTVAKVENLGYEADVYCLTVDKTGVFFVGTAGAAKGGDCPNSACVLSKNTGGI